MHIIDTDQAIDYTLFLPKFLRMRFSQQVRTFTLGVQGVMEVFDFFCLPSQAALAALIKDPAKGDLPTGFFVCHPVEGKDGYYALYGLTPKGTLLGFRNPAGRNEHFAM